MYKHQIMHQLTFIMGLLLGLTVTGVGAKASSTNLSNVNKNSNHQFNLANYFNQNRVQNYKSRLINQYNRYNTCNNANSQIYNTSRRYSIRPSLNNIQYHHIVKQQANHIYNHIIQSNTHYMNVNHQSPYVKRLNKHSKLSRHVTMPINVNNKHNDHLNTHYCIYFNNARFDSKRKVDYKHKSRAIKLTKSNPNLNRYLKVRRHNHVRNWFRDGLSRRNYKARKWVSWHESNHRWNVLSYGGVCVGYFQLNPHYLGYYHGHVNLHKHHQVRVADRYVKLRYGNWMNAKAFWKVHHWY